MIEQLTEEEQKIILNKELKDMKVSDLVELFPFLKKKFCKELFKKPKKKKVVKVKPTKPLKERKGEIVKKEILELFESNKLMTRREIYQELLKQRKISFAKVHYYVTDMLNVGLLNATNLMYTDGRYRTTYMLSKYDPFIVRKRMIECGIMKKVPEKGVILYKDKKQKEEKILR